MNARRLALLAALFVLIFTIIVGISGGTLTAEHAEGWLARGETSALYMVFGFVNVTLVGAVLCAQSRRLWPFVLFSVLGLLCAASYNVVDWRLDSPRHFIDTLAVYGSYLFRPEYLIPLVILVSVRFWRKFEALRLSAIFLILAIIIWDMVALMYTSAWHTFFRTLDHSTTIVATFALTWCAWCILFRQKHGGRPPADAARSVSLTCPRCATAATIPLGGGECTACRLQIFIALDEGTCPNCRYPLRGLTSDRCPECGTSLTPTSAATSAP